MSTSALDGASKYLNNLLLARGFLQDGKPINFVQLAKNNDDTKDFDGNATTANIINLIHDLILRRDRDAEQKEALSTTIRTLRSEESQRILDLQRLQDKNVHFKNELATSEAQQRNAVLSMKKAQAEVREFKEQALKLKSTLDQVRAKAISDIRKRDVELGKLKNHLSGLNRGKKEPTTKTTKTNTCSSHKSTGKDGRNFSEGSMSRELCLEGEDTDFLAAVVNETTTENVALRKIVEDTLTYLKTLSGFEEHVQQLESIPDLASMDNAIGIPGQYRDRDLNNSTDSAQSDTIVPVQSLASSMSEVLSHCQSILRDPSFVPIEEVQIRDEEIAKLRAGWEKMADRWKEAVTMMGQWRQKVMNDGPEEAAMEAAIRQNEYEVEHASSIPVFNRSVAMRPDGRPVLDPIQEEEFTSILVDHHSRIGHQSIIVDEHETTTANHDETLPEPDETGTPRQPTIHIYVDADDESDLNLFEQPAQPTIASPARRGISIQRPVDINSQRDMPLSNSNANAKKRKSPNTSLSPRKRRSLSPVSHEDCSTRDSSVQRSSMVNSSMTHDSTDPLHLDTLTSDSSDGEAEVNSGDIVATSQGKAKATKMTMAQKLAAVEAEATEATEVIRRRQATSYAPTDKRGKDRERSTKTSAGGTLSKSARRPGELRSKSGERSRKTSTQQQRQEKTALKDTGKDKDRVKKARDRRRSTLTPAELGSLMGR